MKLHPVGNSGPYANVSGPDSSGYFTLSNGNTSLSPGNLAGYYCGPGGLLYIIPPGENYKGTSYYKLLKCTQEWNGSGVYYDLQEYHAVNDPIYSKGTTSYGTVTATSSTAYKSGERNQDGYWYVLTSPQ